MKNPTRMARKTVSAFLLAFILVTVITASAKEAALITQSNDPTTFIKVKKAPRNSLGVANDSVLYYSKLEDRAQCKPTKEYGLRTTNTSRFKLNSIDTTAALCVVGNARSFFFPSILYNFNEFAVKPLRNQARVDILIHLIKEPAADSRSITCHPQKDQIRMVYEVIAPVSLRLREWSSCDEYRKETCASCCIPSTSFLQLGWINNCFNAAESYRKKHSKTPYNWFIRMRPDMVFFSRVPSLSRLHLSKVYTAPKLDDPPLYANHDSIFIFSQMMMKKWWKMWASKLRTCKDPHLKICCAEAFMYLPLKNFDNEKKEMIGEQAQNNMIDACLLSDVRTGGRCWKNWITFPNRTSSFWGNVSLGSNASLESWRKRLDTCVGKRHNGQYMNWIAAFSWWSDHMNYNRTRQ
jgi:hypothetical protein